MHNILQHDKKNLATIFSHTVEIATDYLSQQASLPPSRFVEDIMLEALPERGIGAIHALDHFKNNYASLMSNSAGPRYFGFVTGGSTPASIAGDWLVSAFDQNVCEYNTIAAQLERQTIHFLKQLLQLDHRYFGTFVTGATMSNFVSLAQARQWVGEQQGIDISQQGLSDSAPIKIFSGTPHSSVLKSLSMLGIGRNSLQKISTLPDREAIDVIALEKALGKSDTPAIVIANAGTVNTVDFDDLEAIGKLKSKYNFWLHIDAAFGGFAACSKKYAHFVNGINHADSITIDAHKWLNVPYDGAMQFSKHKDVQLRVFQNSAAYLGDPAESPDLFHYTPENSRRFRALPSWFTVMAYGAEGYREIVERNCHTAYLLGEKIKQSTTFKLLAPVHMNVVCFTLQNENLTMDLIRELLTAVRDNGQVFFTQTLYKGIPAIRAAISNWQTESTDVDVAFEALEKTRDKV